MKAIRLLLCAAVGTLLVACSPEEDKQSSLDNAEQNSQEYHDTAAEPAGPNKLVPPSTGTAGND